MNRNELIQQVKEEYASLAHSENQQHFHQTATDITPEAYYEKLLNAVITEISNGKFDNYQSGNSIVNAVAVDKTLLSEWK